MTDQTIWESALDIVRDWWQVVAGIAAGAAAAGRMVWWGLIGKNERQHDAITKRMEAIEAECATCRQKVFVERRADLEKQRDERKQDIEAAFVRAMEFMKREFSGVFREIKELRDDLRADRIVRSNEQKGEQ